LPVEAGVEVVFAETERGCGGVARNELLFVRTLRRKIAKDPAKNANSLVAEVTDARKHHRNARFVRGFDDLRVLFAAAWLYHRGDAVFESGF
jgi:hypothetical protein